MVMCLERGADCLHMVQLMPLHPKTPSSLALFKSRLVLPVSGTNWVSQNQRPLCSSSGSGSGSSYICSLSSSFSVFLTVCFIG